MFINIIKSLMIFTAGIIIGYLTFSQKTFEPLDAQAKTAPLIEEQSAVQPQAMTKPEIKVGESIDSETLNKLDKLIESQRQQITSLKAELAQQKTLSNRLQNQKKQTETAATLESVSMEDFEKKMKSQFLDRFKGYAIELEGKRLESIKSEFDKDSEKAEWSHQYETHINSYIQDNDPNRLHFIDELNCNNNMCRLKVNSSESDKWKSLFLSLTQQSWYNSITLKENSGDSSIFIYYITRPQESM